LIKPGEKRIEVRIFWKRSKKEGEKGGPDFGITISRATILTILLATGSYPVSPFSFRSF